MAVVTTVHAEMELVTEKCARIPECYILDRMTLFAGAFYGKCRLAVMTGTAGVSTLHLRHIVPLCILSGRENPVMALITLIKTGVELVTESYRTGLPHRKLDLLG